MAVSATPPDSNGKDVLNEEPESEELKSFRQQWLQELQKRKREDIVSSLSPLGIGQDLPNVDESENLTIRHNEHPLVMNGVIRGEDDMPSSLRKALDFYRRAVGHEQAGELDEALLLYRQAFRLDDKVDRAYRRTSMLERIAERQDDSHIEGCSATLQRPPLIKHPNTTTIFNENFSRMIGRFPKDLKFEPEDENEPVFLNKLPDEVLVLIISNLDPTSIENFAKISRKARLVSLDAGIWRAVVLETYRPPQIHRDTLLAILEDYLFDYRRVFIEQPRVRLDGVYIAICHYVRPGMSENHWANVSHVITYHRYLRFFPNGQVLSLLANEERSPKEIIPLMKPQFRMKGLFLGQWKLAGTTVHLSHLVDASARIGVDFVSSDSRASNPDTGATLPANPHRRNHGSSTWAARYTFEMTLNLRSKPLGKWNKMSIHTYNSVNLENGDVHPVALKHERPFWFSKVRSYV